MAHAPKRTTSPQRDARGDAPYRRMAADIRRRIANGELSAGARVPSTRRIAREWSVALATATKALVTLRHEGSIRALPRVGNVVTGAAPPMAAAPRRARREAAAGPELTRERIVQVAIEIADAEGLLGLSMRGVAAKLAVPTSSRKS